MARFVMMKGDRKMKKSKKMTVLGVEGIEDGLMGMGRLIEAGGPWTHGEMKRIPEWRGADVRITSDFERDLVPLHTPRPIRSSRPAEGMRSAREFNEPGYFDHDLTVRTRHAGPVTWFIFQMRDLFDGWLDGGNKYGFYELLAQGALEHRASREIEDRIWKIGGFVKVKVNVNDGTGDADAGVFDAGGCQGTSCVAG